MTIYSPEEQCLLGNGEASSEHSLSNNNTESLTQTEGCNSHESIGPLQSTVALNRSHSALSEPMTLLSNADPATPAPSVPTVPQSPCQPTSPQIISPLTTSPHVNVNITFHIGNGSGGMPSLIPTNLKEPDSKLPFGEEEKCYSIPQQEDGKQSQISVQDSESYCVWRATCRKTNSFIRFFFFFFMSWCNTDNNLTCFKEKVQPLFYPHQSYGLLLLYIFVYMYIDNIVNKDVNIVSRV